jgi:glycosyltransferase involved in cell wall biosynthesis
VTQPKVSVIVPVFNGEGVVEECIGSLLNQSLTDIEIILVDDGSTDGTSAICNRYAAADTRVMCVRRPNGGVSVARNQGLDLARGTYLAFADADDIVPPGGIDALVRVAHGNIADLVIGDYEIANGGNTHVIRSFRSPSNEELLQSLLDGRNHSALWNKLIRRSTLGRMRFPSEIKYAEDQVMLVELLLSKPINVAFSHEVVYTHRISLMSTTSSGGRALFDLLKAKLTIAQMLHRAGITEELRLSFSKGAENAILYVVRNIDMSLAHEVREHLISYAHGIERFGFPLFGLTRARALLALVALPVPVWNWAFKTLRSRSSALRMKLRTHVTQGPAT